MHHPDASIAYVLMCGVLILTAWYDYKTTKIPNWITFPAAGFGLIYWTIAGSVLHGSAFNGLTDSVVSLLVGFVPVLIVHLCKGCGAGDAKLMGATGAMCGNYEVMTRILILGTFCMAIHALTVMIVERRTKKTFSKIFGALLMAVAKVNAELDKDKRPIPVAVPFCVAGIIVGTEEILGFRFLGM